MPKLNCQETQNLLEASHDNELDGVTSLSVQEHLDECPDCRRQWRWLCEVEASLRRLTESVPSPDQDLRRNVLRPTSTLAGPVLALFRTHRRLAGVVSLAEVPQLSQHALAFKRLCEQIQAIFSTTFWMIFGDVGSAKPRCASSWATGLSGRATRRRRSWPRFLTGRITSMERIVETSNRS